MIKISEGGREGGREKEKERERERLTYMDQGIDLVPSKRPKKSVSVVLSAWALSGSSSPVQGLTLLAAVCHTSPLGQPHPPSSTSKHINIHRYSTC